MSESMSGSLGAAAVAAIAAVQAKLDATNALTFGSQQFVTLIADVGTAQAAINAVIVGAEASINTLGGTAVTGPTGGLSWVNGAAADVANLANAVAANGPIARIATNLANAST